MGSSKNGGLQKVPTMTSGQSTYLDKLLQQYAPGGQGGKALEEEANANFRNQTVPDILSAYGGDNKGSSYLNSALSGAASNLNRGLAADKSQQTLQAAQIGLGAQPFGYVQKPKSPLQELLLGGIGNAGGIASLIKLFMGGS